MTARPCHICGAVPAPLGLAFPGPSRLHPANRRGRLRHCGAEACREAAEARLAKALLAEGWSLPAHLARFAPPPSAPTGQGRLFELGPARALGRRRVP